MMHYLKKLFSLVSRAKTKKESTPLTLLQIWHRELAVLLVLSALVCGGSIWIYHTMIPQGVETSKNRVSVIEPINKEELLVAKTKISKHENWLNNPLFPLIKDPF